MTAELWGALALTAMVFADAWLVVWLLGLPPRIDKQEKP